jgi:DNA-binding HxlR family transcriptional regulator
VAELTAEERDNRALCRWLWLSQRRLLAGMDDVWRTWQEVRRLWPEASRHILIGTLRELRGNGLVDYRKSDAHGRGEWARTEHGARVVASWEGTRWMP